MTLINYENEVVLPVIPREQKNTLFALAEHTHEISGVNGLQEVLDSKQVSGDYATVTQVSVTASTILDTLSTTATVLVNEINTKQPSGDYSLNGHTHAISAVDNLQEVLDSKQVTGDYATNSSVATTASNIIDLINTKQPSGDYALADHTHEISGVNNLQETLDSKQVTGDYATNSSVAVTAENLINILNTKQPSGDYSVEGHTHAISGVDGLQSALDSKQPSGDYATVTQVSVTAANLTSLINTKQPSGDYATNSSVAVTAANLTSLINTKQPSGDYALANHTHAISAVTGLQSALDSKASSAHTHAISGVTGLQTILDTIPSTADFSLADHAHGNITNDGYVGSVSGLPLITGVSGIVETGTFGTSAGQFAEGDHIHVGMVDESAMSIYRSSKDINGIWRVIEYKRADGTLYKNSTLGPNVGETPVYSRRRVTYYDLNGIDVLEIKWFDLTYVTTDLLAEVIGVFNPLDDWDL